MNYISTRGNAERLTASMAILKGIAEDGGLFVPENIPVIDKSLESLADMDYRELAYEILKLYFTDFESEELKACINNAYDEKFDSPEIAPLVEKDGLYFMELFHGKTLAFKDMALSLLPYILKASARKNNIDKEIVILTATSGDTGKAALEGFKNVEGTRIIVFYPENGVSLMQKLQMATQEGANTFVVGIKGNFDDAQTGVKRVFTDKAVKEELEKSGYIFSSANSINIGRLVPQIVYYFSTYLKLVKAGNIKSGDRINFVVPTGNFGNILAGYYAKQMGLPVNELICASNENKVLCDFFNTKNYDVNRKFVPTMSPSMDILVSSNLERLLYHKVKNPDMVKDLMDSLDRNSRYELNEEFPDFASYFATEEETGSAIKEVYEKYGYIIDTHTAVAYTAYKKHMPYVEGETVIVCTASPFKFTGSVMKSIFEQNSQKDDFELAGEMAAIMHKNIPPQISELKTKEALHSLTIETSEIKDTVINILKK